MAKRLLLIADVSNLYFTVGKKFGRKLDYQKFLERVVGNHELYRAIAYGAEMNDEAAGFKAALTHMGYEPKYKEPKVHPTDNPNFENRKADWDVGMAVDAMKMVAGYDIVVFGTADSDLAPCLEYLKSLGKECWVYACRISHELKSIADRYWEIDQSLLEGKPDVASTP